MRAIVTPEDYFRLEHSSQERHELIDGVVRELMSHTHARSVIWTNICRRLGDALRGSNCRVLSSGMRLRLGAGQNYSYADMTVVCGEHQCERSGPGDDTLLNPTWIVEILDPETEGYVRGEKFACYREIESLREYVLVAQDRPRIETFYRQDDGAWQIEIYDGLDAVVPLSSLGVALRARDVYADVDPVPSPGTPGEG